MTIGIVSEGGDVPRRRAVIPRWVPKGSVEVRGPAFSVGRLEELDGIAGRVVEQDLRAADAGQNLVTEP